MAETLTVKRFGPIKEAKIDVKDMIVFIGAQSSGKSTLAKLITILNDFNFRQNNDVSIFTELEKYNLKSFVKKNTFIQYESSFFRFTLDKGKEDKFDYKSALSHFLNKKEHTDDDLHTIRLVLGIMIRVIYSDGKSHVLIRELQKDDHFGLINNSESLFPESIKYSPDFEKIPDNILSVYGKNISLSELNELARQVTQVFSFIRPLDSLYVPAERTLIPLIVNNIAGLVNNKIAFPHYVLQAVQEFEKSLQTVEKFDLSIIGNLRYSRSEGKSYIYHSQKNKILLKEASSGVQSILPILLLIESSVQAENYINLNYVVEEPELNLYPEAQYGLIKHLVKFCLETDHKVQSKNLIITTHSPYILASINNLLLASKKGKVNEQKASKIINKVCWINPENFNAYEVIDGKVKQIYNKKENLISDNIINDVSEIIMEDFKSLAIIND